MSKEDQVLKRLEKDNPELYEIYKKEGLITPLTKSLPIKEITLSPLLNQIVLAKLGNYVSERLSIDKYYLVDAIYILLGEFSEDELKKGFPNYEATKKSLEKLNKKIQVSKTYYDAVLDKNFKTKFKDLDTFQKFLRKQLFQVSAKIPPIQPDIYKLFVYLISNCSIKGYTIRQDMLKVLEYRDNARIDLSKRKKETSSPVLGGS